MGELHNKTLDYVNSQALIREIPREELLRTINTWVMQKPELKDYSNSPLSRNLPLDDANKYLSLAKKNVKTNAPSLVEGSGPFLDVTEVLAAMREDDKITLEQETIMLAFFNGLVNLTSAAEARQYVTAFETTIINGNYGVDDKAIYLGTAAVLKYSIAYWETNTDGFGLDPNALATRGRCRWYHWFCIAPFDALGFFVGAAGGLATSAGNPIIGVGAGVVVGSLASTVAINCGWCGCNGSWAPCM